MEKGPATIDDMQYGKLQQVPEKNWVNALANLFYYRGVVTRGHSPQWLRDHPNLIQRPLHARAKRAELLRKLPQRPKTVNTNFQGGFRGRYKELYNNNAGMVFHEAHERDRITREYLTQAELFVYMPDLGVQMAKTATLTPPPDRRLDLPPIILLGGISNDLEPVATLAQEAAFQGRTVIMIGYPESTQGKVTPFFADAVERNDPFTTHAEFFKEAVRTLLPDSKDGTPQEFELWGYSTGGPVGAIILNDQQFAERVSNAVFICPAASVDQSKREFNSGMKSEITNAIKNRFDNLAKYSFVQPKLSDRLFKRNRDKNRVFGKLMKDILQFLPAYKTAKVREGGKILIVSGEEDHVTKSARAEKAFRENPFVDVRTIPGGTHLTPLIDAETIVQNIFNF